MVKYIASVEKAVGCLLELKDLAIAYQNPELLE